MAKRKRSHVEEAAIVLLTTDLNDLNIAILSSLEERFRPERSETTTPQGPLAEVLYELLFRIEDIRAFFSSSNNVVPEMFQRPDRRIEVLRKSSQVTASELSLSQKYERFLADRSLALACGNTSVKYFVQSLKVTSEEDRKLARNGTYRGKEWQRLEDCVGEAGISAVASCEHTLFQKCVKTADFSTFAECLKTPLFAPILDVARTVTPILIDAQNVFDIAVRGESHRYTACETNTHTRSNSQETSGVVVGGEHVTNAPRSACHDSNSLADPDPSEARVAAREPLANSQGKTSSIKLDIFCCLRVPGNGRACIIRPRSTSAHATYRRPTTQIDATFTVSPTNMAQGVTLEAQDRGGDLPRVDEIPIQNANYEKLKTILGSFLFTGLRLSVTRLHELEQEQVSDLFTRTAQVILPQCEEDDVGVEISIQQYFGDCILAVNNDLSVKELENFLGSHLFKAMSASKTRMEEVRTGIQCTTDAVNISGLVNGDRKLSILVPYGEGVGIWLEIFPF